MLEHLFAVLLNQFLDVRQHQDARLGPVLQRVFAKLNLQWEDYVEIDPRYFRPTEVEYLHGDPSKARELLGWKPKVSFSELVDRMVSHDLNLAEQERTLLDAGHRVTARGKASG
jgi:GDPmannose 4,6-dehydratase